MHQRRKSSGQLPQLRIARCWIDPVRRHFACTSNHRFRRLLIREKIHNVYVT